MAGVSKFPGLQTSSKEDPRCLTLKINVKRPREVGKKFEEETHNFAEISSGSARNSAIKQNMPVHAKTILPLRAKREIEDAEMREEC